MNLSSVESHLRSRLEQMQARLGKLNADLSQPHSSDSQEQAVERENDEVLEGLAKETLESIGHIKAALERIELGQYGVCARCGEPIEEQRLIALPETRYCVDCAN